MNVSSERISDPVIFICDICRLPIVNHGRLVINHEKFPSLFMFSYL